MRLRTSAFSCISKKRYIEHWAERRDPQESDRKMKPTTILAYRHPDFPMSFKTESKSREPGSSFKEIPIDRIDKGLNLLTKDDQRHKTPNANVSFTK